MNGGSYTFSIVFSNLPKELSDKLEQCYTNIRRNYREGKHEPVELNGGKFSECVYRILEWKTTGKYIPIGTQISNFGDSLKKFENLTSEPESIRFHIPNVLNALFDIRNKRDVGHIAKDINPNEMDAMFVVSAANWVMAELVRVFHSLKPEEAQAIIETITAKEVPLIWAVGDVKRVLAPKMSFKDKTLALLYSQLSMNATYEQLFSWTEHSNGSIYKRDVIKPLHTAKLIEYDDKTGIVTISPSGLKYTETNILK